MIIDVARDWFTATETMSELSVDGVFFGYGIELPWMDGQNIPDKSAILPGLYVAIIRYSPKNKTNVFELQGVPGRKYIEWHAANHASELLGCGAPGMSRFVSDQHAGFVIDSRKALGRLLEMGEAAIKRGEIIQFQIVNVADAIAR